MGDFFKVVSKKIKKIKVVSVPVVAGGTEVEKGSEAGLSPADTSAVGM